MKLLAFGEVMMRLMCEGNKLLTQTDQFFAQYTGTGVNIAAGVYQLGDEVYLATTLPDNHVGKAAAATLRKIGIHDDFVRFESNHIGIYVLEQGIGNRPSYVTYLNRKDSAFGLAKSDAYAFDDMLEGMDGVHICGITLAMSAETRTCAFTLAKKAKAKGIKVFFDCNYRPSLWEHNDVDPNDVYQEMANLADVMFASPRDGGQLEIATANRSDEQILIDMQNKFKLEIIYGTKRDKDMYQGYMLKDNKLYESQPYHLTIFDRIGAGDAFAAGAIHGYYHLNDVDTWITFATVCGVLGHTTYGDTPELEVQEIERFIKYGPCDILR